MEIQLSNKEFVELLKMQRRERDTRRYKKLTVIVMLHRGYEVSDIEQALGLDDNTIRRYAKIFAESSYDEYLSDGYSGKMSFLSSGEEQQLSDHLDNHLYSDVKEVIIYVDGQYGVLYSESGMTKLLHRLGFVYKQAKSIPSKADDDAQRSFLEEQLEPMLEEVKSGEAVIYFADGCHPTHNTNTGRGWIRKGREFPIQSNSGRQRVNINAAINASKPEHLVYEITDTINAQSTRRICRQLLKKHPHKRIYLICDNARYNRNKMLTKWVEGQRIELVYLPPYSPNLNLIERLWRLMRNEVISLTYYDTYSKFKNEIEYFLDNAKQYKDELRKLMTLNFRTVGGVSYYAQI